MAVGEFLFRWWRPASKAKPAPRPRLEDSGFYATQFADRHDEAKRIASWKQQRPADMRERKDDASGINALMRLFGQDRALAALGADLLKQLATQFDYVEVDAGKRVFGQDEKGDYLMIVLQGAVAEERAQPSGGKVRLGEVRTGEVLGDLSVLDGGTRLCSCTALTPLHLAVLAQPVLDRLLADEPRLAAALLSWLAKRLSLRLRQVSARVSVLLTRMPAAAASSNEPPR
jgi:CRP/FNR family cyclic AMP-dependent transcriptional regulator